MFLFIGGIKSKTVIIEQRPQACPSCGRFDIKLKRVDSYLSFFFIPLIRVKKGQLFLECDSCGGMFSTEAETYTAEIYRCSFCGKPAERNHVFCPYCGHHL